MKLDRGNLKKKLEVGLREHVVTEDTNSRRIS